MSLPFCFFKNGIKKNKSVWNIYNRVFQIWLETQMGSPVEKIAFKSFSNLFQGSKWGLRSYLEIIYDWSKYKTKPEILGGEGRVELSKVST